MVLVAEQDLGLRHLQVAYVDDPSPVVDVPDIERLVREGAWDRLAEVTPVEERGSHRYCHGLVRDESALTEICNSKINLFS